MANLLLERREAQRHYTTLRVFFRNDVLARRSVITFRHFPVNSAVFDLGCCATEAGHPYFRFCRRVFRHVRFNRKRNMSTAAT